MQLVQPWFMPFGIAVGLFGFRTALVEKRARGGRWRVDSVLLLLLVWFPMVIWALACVMGPME